VDRLRGIYTVPVNDGAGLLNGKAEVTHRYATAPISRRAAQRIQDLTKGS